MILRSLTMRFRRVENNFKAKQDSGRQTAAPYRPRHFEETQDQCRTHSDREQPSGFSGYPEFGCKLLI